MRWLRKNAAQYGLDPERFGAIGGSASGHLASYMALADTRDNSDAALAVYSSRVRCVVDCYGPVDLVGMMQSASAPIVQAFIGKPLEGNEEDYRKASPVSYVKKNPPPFLIVYGTILHRPEFRVTIPAGKVLAVENAHIPCLWIWHTCCVPGCCGRADRCPNRRKHHDP